MDCDCGARALGIKNGAAGHSGWCATLAPAPVQDLSEEAKTPTMGSSGLIWAPLQQQLPLPQSTQTNPAHHLHTIGAWQICISPWGNQIDIYNYSFYSNVIRVTLYQNTPAIGLYNNSILVDSQMLMAWNTSSSKSLIMAMLYTKMNISLSITQETQLLEALKYIWNYKAWP